jgi:hypothetical protein
MPGVPLRVLVLVDQEVVPAWIAAVANELDRASWAELTCELVSARGAAGDSGHSFHWLARGYVRWDRRHGVGPDALAAAAIRLAAAERDAMPVPPARPDEVDVVLDLTGGQPRAAPRTRARYGQWSFAHGDGRTARDGRPALLDAVLGGLGPCEIVLSCRAGSDEEEFAVARSVSPTHPVSLHRQRNAVLWKSARLAIRALHRLAHQRSLQPLVEAAGVPEHAPAGHATRSVLAAAARLGGHLAWHAVVTRGLARLKTDEWFVALQPRSASSAPAHERLPDAASMRGARPVHTERDTFLADPFLLEEGDQTWLFVEEWDASRGYGYLAAANVLADGTLGSRREVLRRPHHLSYPFVFRHGDQAYLLPESSASKSVDLYRAVALPDRWEKVGTLVQGFPAVDPTLIVHDGRFWLWVAYAETGSWTRDELLVYYSDHLDGGWTPHPLNPVVSDAGRARPGGTPFLHRGRLIRPAQDCVAASGKRIVLHEVQVMTSTEYREVVVGAVEPEWRPDLSSTHTYARGQRWEAIDGRRVAWRIGPRRLPGASW